MDARRKAARYGVFLLERLLSRRLAARTARFVWLQSRRDGSNDMSVNGETLVQRSLAAAERHAVIFDVGAHFGEWTESLLVQTRRSDFRVVCFEPSAITFLRLTEATERLTCVERHQLALGDKPGEATLNIVHAGAGSNSLLPTGQRPRTEQETVRVDTVDDFCGRNGIGSLALLKVDAEGFDMRVMRGAVGMLRKRAVGLIQFEYNHRWVHGRCFLKDAFDLLSPLGYTIGKVTPDGVELYDAWHPELETFREGNYLAFQGDAPAGLPRLPWWGP
ncbi:MAG: FkbM family methyltransferase [Actinobacteria bacterium]|nr:FkbM family methyltransferase [Actinomycetota bacterium]